MKVYLIQERELALVFNQTYYFTMLIESNIVELETDCQITKYRRTYTNPIKGFVPRTHASQYQMLPWFFQRGCGFRSKINFHYE